MPAPPRGPAVPRIGYWPMFLIAMGDKATDAKGYGARRDQNPGNGMYELGAFYVTGGGHDGVFIDRHCESR